jgi:hypothetical protein
VIGTLARVRAHLQGRCDCFERQPFFGKLDNFINPPWIVGLHGKIPMILTAL